MDGTPEVAYGTWGEPGGGTRIDGSAIHWRARRSDAVADARSIGWPVNSVWPVHTRFQDGYAIGQTFGGYLTRAAFTALARNRAETNGEISA
jgi:hypothetical protein